MTGCSSGSAHTCTHNNGFWNSKNRNPPITNRAVHASPKWSTHYCFQATWFKSTCRDSSKKKITDCDAVILENHGIITVGSTIETACNLNEMVEEAAKIQLSAMTLAGRDALDLAKLKEKFKTENTVG